MRNQTILDIRGTLFENGDYLIKSKIVN